MSLKDIIASDKPTLVNFYASWCPPCKIMKPNLDEAVNTLGDSISYERLDIDENRDLTNQYKIMSVPTTIIFKNGEVRWRQAGVYPANEIVRLLKENM